MLVFQVDGMTYVVNIFYPNEAVATFGYSLDFSSYPLEIQCY